MLMEEEIAAAVNRLAERQMYLRWIRGVRENLAQGFERLKTCCRLRSRLCCSSLCSPLCVVNFHSCHHRCIHHRHRHAHYRLRSFRVLYFPRRGHFTVNRKSEILARFWRPFPVKVNVISNLIELRKFG